MIAIYTENKIQAIALALAGPDSWPHPENALPFLLKILALTTKQQKASGFSSLFACCRTLYGDQARFFEDEIRPHLRHKKKGIVGMAGGGKNMNASQFYITTAAELDSLDDKHTIFGEVLLLPPHPLVRVLLI